MQPFYIVDYGKHLYIDENNNIISILLEALQSYAHTASYTVFEMWGITIGKKNDIQNEN